MTIGPHQQLADTVVSLADTLVDDFDLLDFLGLLAERLLNTSTSPQPE